MWTPRYVAHRILRTVSRAARPPSPTRSASSASTYTAEKIVMWHWQSDFCATFTITTLSPSPLRLRLDRVNANNFGPTSFPLRSQKASSQALVNLGALPTLLSFSRLCLRYSRFYASLGFPNILERGWSILSSSRCALWRWKPDAMRPLSLAVSGVGAPPASPTVPLRMQRR